MLATFVLSTSIGVMAMLNEEETEDLGALHLRSSISTHEFESNQKVSATRGIEFVDGICVDCNSYNEAYDTEAQAQAACREEDRTDTICWHFNARCACKGYLHVPRGWVVLVEGVRTYDLSDGSLEGVDVLKVVQGSTDSTYEYDGNALLDASFWEQECTKYCADKISIEFDDCGTTDWYRPVTGASWCDMFLAKNQHQVSFDGGVTWVTPVEHHFAGSGFLGGSNGYWLRDSRANPGDVRLFIPFWGRDHPASRGGLCCNQGTGHSSQCGWGKSFKITQAECAEPGSTCNDYSGDVGYGSEFWGEECSKYSAAAKLSITFDSCGTTDYFMGTGSWVDICMLLTHRNRHMWSDDGETWQNPAYITNPVGWLGGSNVGWPADGRGTLPFWGGAHPSQDGGSQNGGRCCVGDKNCNWGQSFRLCGLP